MEQAFGINVGHGYTKLLVIDDAGQETVAVVLPSMIAPAELAFAGAVAEGATVQVGDETFWVGADAELAPHPLTDLSVARLSDARLLPALIKGAWAQSRLNGSVTGYCVTGLPANQHDRNRATALAARIREAIPGAFGPDQVEVIAEPVGVLYGELLTAEGAMADDDLLAEGRVGVIDLGHLTVDVAEVLARRPVAGALDTWELGTVRPLGSIRAVLASKRELTLHQIDQAIRAGGIRVRGEFFALSDLLGPTWDAPLQANGRDIAARLVERWGSGTHLDAVLIGGGGAALPQVTSAIQERFPQARTVTDPQMAVARGYARLARYRLRHNVLAAPAQEA
jgi:plasmid segregation protein ParM